MKKSYYPIFILVALFLFGQKLLAQIDYATQIQPIFNASCTGCHNAGFAQANVDLSSYSAVLNSIGGTCGGSIVIPGNANSSNLISKVDPAIAVCGGGAMPQGGPAMSAANIALIRTWINQGAAPADPSGGTYYNTFVGPVFAANCQVCHNSGFAQANVMLDTRVNTQNSIGTGCGKTVMEGDAAGSPLMSKIDPNIPVCSGNPMPPPAGGVVTNAEVNAIAQWINSLITLPVEIITFEANYDEAEHEVRLNWEVNDDHLLDFFTIERSQNGFDFEPIGTIPSHRIESTSQHYMWQDTEPFYGKVYYRLHQTDVNGDPAYSNTVETFVSPVSQSIHLFPNPASTQVNLEVFASKDEIMQIEVTSLLGQKIFQESLLLHAGSNLSTMETTHWTPGIYLVRMYSNGVLNKAVKLIVE